MADKGKKIKYSEPADYFPKELRDRIMAAGKTAKAKTTSSDKKSSDKKKK